MVTVDQMIERLNELRDVSPQGGDTPVVIRDIDNIYETALVELMPVIVKMTEAGSPVTWENRENGNTDLVVRVF